MTKNAKYTVGLIIDSGLGNQLFMIFALISYCIDTLTDFFIFYKKNNMQKTYWDTIFKSLSNNIQCDTQPQTNIYNEKKFHYSKIPIFDTNTTLKGYFQSYKYFHHNIHHILKYIDFYNHIDNIKNEYKDLFNKKTVALHFRIGDYMGLQNMHPIQKPEYYIKSFDYLINTLKKNNENIADYDILYFCQECDNHIVEQYLNILKYNYNYLNFVKIDDNIPDWKQLLIMTLCDHFIIANSTFSWHPAYLSSVIKNTKSIVCYPTHWFGPYYSKNITTDLFLPEWIGFSDI